MLSFYAIRLPSLEINNTFYRVPKSAVVASWAEQVPEGFRFVLKASRRVTHQRRLADVEEPVHFVWRAATKLGEHRGPILFQLPPTMRKDAPRLAAFLAALPEACQALFEFRHASWFDDEVLELLRGAGAALCIAETEADAEPELTETADWGYARLRKPSYEDDELRRWAERLRARPWREVYMFFKHEDASGPAQALRLAELF